MSRAYCLTCNEQVLETAGGTCPEGHPVTAHDEGPEPWVGFAGDSDVSVDGSRLGTRRPVELARMDAAGRPVAHAGSRTNGSTNGAVNGYGSALGGGHGSSDPFPSTFGHRSSFAADAAPASPTERAPANGQAADDLAALLAEALSETPAQDPELADTDTPAAEVDTGGWSEVVRDDQAIDTTDLDTVDADALEAVDDHRTDGAGDADHAPPWDDLASLAAELHLEADHRDDGPTAAPPVDPAPTSLDAPSFDESAIDSADIDALLAELTGSPSPTPEAATPPPPPPAPAPEPERPARTAFAPPPPPDASPAAPAPSADTSPWDAPPPLDDVPSALSAPEPVDAWYEPVPTDDVPAPMVDLNNFTARGGRVGGAAPADRKKRRRKR